MDLAYLRAFREVMLRVLDIYGFEEVCVQDFFVVDGAVFRPHCVSAAIALRGGVEGSAALVVADADAVSIAGRVVQADLDPGQREDIVAIVAELANIVVGNVTSELYRLGFDVEISPPHVEEGGSVQLRFPRNAESVVAPIDTRQGRIELYVSIVSLPSPGHPVA